MAGSIEPYFFSNVSATIADTTSMKPKHSKTYRVNKQYVRWGAYSSSSMMLNTDATMIHRRFQIDVKKWELSA